jgi:hypothetical protein
MHLPRPIERPAHLTHSTNVAGGSLSICAGGGTGDPAAWRHLGPRQHRGLRGRLQTALETESAPSAYAACNRVGSAEMPARLLQVTHGSSPRGVLEISVTLYPPTTVLSLSSCLSPVITHYRYPESKQYPFYPPSPLCLPYIDISLERLV